jgi:hypothetical protein
MRTVFNNIVDNGNLEPTPNTEYIYVHDTVWINHKPVDVDMGILVCDVEQGKYGDYTFCIVGEKDQRYNCAYGWAFVKNTDENMLLLEQIEKGKAELKKHDTKLNDLRNKLDRLFTDKPNEPADKSNDLSADEIYLSVGDPHTMDMLNEARERASKRWETAGKLEEYDVAQNPNGLTDAKWVKPINIKPSTNWFFAILYKILKHDMINKLKVKHGEQFIDDVMETFGIPSNLMDNIHAGLPKVVDDKVGKKHICDCHPTVPERLKNMLNTKCRICGGIIGKPKEIDEKNIKCFKLIKPYPGMTKINAETSDSYGFRNDDWDELYPGMPWFLDWPEYWEPIMNKID